jgi:hypothetical protein
MPGTFPGVAFVNGVCGFCRAHEAAPQAKRTVLGESAFRELLASGAGGSYDCAVPTSGGKDSSYVLYYVVRTLGLRPLSLFDDIAYDPYPMIETLKRDVGRQSPAGRESRMDCRIHCFGDFQPLRDTGITCDGFTMAHLVRSGLLSRDEAPASRA